MDPTTPNALISCPHGSGSRSARFHRRETPKPSSLGGVQPRHLRVFAPVLLALLMALGLACPARAQGTRADYQRSASYLRRVRDKVFRTRVVPHWFGNNDVFWYRVATGPGTHEFVLVDAARGERRAAFDHKRLAEALAAAARQKVEPTSLPFRSIALDEERQELRFQAFGKRWVCSLRDYRLREESRRTHSGAVTPRNTFEGVAVLRSLQASSDGNGETAVRFVNRTDRPLHLDWIDRSGRPRRYVTLQPNAEHDQHTFAGHVWRLSDAHGRTFALIAATGDEGLVVVREPEPQPSHEPPDRAASSRSARAPAAAGRKAGDSPDGRWRAMVHEHNVVVEDRSTGERFALSTDGSAENAYRPPFYWSPDSRYLAALQVERGQERFVYLIESAPPDQLQPKLHRLPYLKPGDKIPHPRPRLFDVVERRAIPISEKLFPNPWSITRIRWRPDGRGFTFLYNQRGHQVLRLIEVSVPDGMPRVIIDETSRTFVDYAHKLFLQFVPARRTDSDASPADSAADGPAGGPVQHVPEQIIWMSERDGWNHLYLIDADSGRVQNPITRGQWVVRGVERVDPETRQIWFRAGGLVPGQDPYFVHLCRVNFDGTGFVRLTDGNGTHSWQYSPDRRWLIDTWSRVDLPPVHVLRDARTGELVCELERGDWSRLRATGWRPPEPFVAKGRDGKTDIFGVIVRPTTFDPAKKYPVIEKIYAGPQSAYVPKAFGLHPGLYEMAELGFIVVQIDGMGTSYRSKAFHDVCWKNLGDAGFPDRIAWIKAAAARHPEMDITRVGLFGGSAGGQNALRGLLVHGDFYKAAAADCGCHDNRMDKIWWNELWMGWPVGPHYAEQSNVTQAHRLQGKLLLTVGELDRNVDPASTMQVVDALIKVDKDFELIVVPGAGHGAGERPYAKRRRADFFVRALWGREPRAE